MPSIAALGNATGTFGYQDSINVQSGSGFARFECPVGTIVAEFTGQRNFGPYDGLTWKVTSLTGALYYEIADGNSINAAASSAKVNLAGLVIANNMVMSGSRIYASGVSSSITDSAGQATTESTLVSVTIPGGTLGANDGLWIEPLWSCTNSAATKRTRLRFGGNVLTNLDLTTHLVFPQRWYLRNRNSVSSQVGAPNSTTVFGPIGSVGAQTFTIDFSVDQTLTVTGQFPVTGSGTNTLACEGIGMWVF